MNPECDVSIYLWDGEYDAWCILPPDHEGDHWDGGSWFRVDDDDQRWFTDDDHDGPGPERGVSGD